MKNLLKIVIFLSACSIVKAANFQSASLSYLNGDQQWNVGIEYDYWKNKFGIKNGPSLKTNQNAWSFLTKWHF